MEETTSFTFSEDEKQLIIVALEGAIEWSLDSSEALAAQLLIYRLQRSDRGADLLGAAHGTK